MKKLRKILLWVLLILLSLPIIVYGLAWYFSNDLKKYAVEQINSNLSAKLEVEQIHVALFRDFPNIELHLQQVNITNKPNMPKGNLLKVKNIYIHFNLWEVISQNYQISNIELDSGAITGMVSDEGNYNYDIIKTDSTTANKSDFWLQLNYIELRHIDFIHTQNDLKTSFHINQLSALCNINTSQIQFEQKSSIEKLNIQKGNTNLCENRSVESYLKGLLNLDKETYAIEQSELTSGDLKTELIGNIYYGKHSNIDLSLKGKEMKITSLLSLLGVSLKEQEYKSEGNIYFDCQLKGNTYEKNSPLLHINFGIKNGKLSKSDKSLDNIYLLGKYYIPENKSIESSTLQISQLSAKINQSKIHGDLLLEGITNPRIEANLIGTIHAKDIEFLYDKSASMSGQIGADLHIHYHPEKGKKMVEVLKAEGKLELDNIVYSPYQISQLSGSLNFNKNHIEIKNMNGYYQESDFALKGNFSNWYGYLFNHETLKLDAQLNSKKLIFKTANSTDTASSLFVLPEQVDATLNMDCDALYFNNLHFADVTTNAHMQNNRIALKHIKAKSFGGSLVFENILFQKEQKGFSLATQGNISNISISDFFHDFNNFGQAVLTHRHLKGKASIRDLSVYLFFDERLNIISQKIKSLGHLIIEDGEVNDFEPALKLGKFIDVNELKNLKFNKLENDIMIEDGMIHIPQMYIQSNAINMNVKGEHDFNNKLDYYIKVKLNEVLFKKRKKPANDEFGELIDEGRKGVYLYLHMTGIPPDIKIVYDKKGFKNEASKVVKEEKKKVKELFKNDFKKVNDDELNPKKNKPNEPQEKQEIDWDG